MITAAKKYLDLGNTIVQTFFFLRNLTKNCGEPVNWSHKKLKEFFHSLGDNDLMANRFLIASDMRANQAIFRMNVEKYLDYEGEFTIDKFFRTIHLDYLRDYLKWSVTIYLHAQHIKTSLMPMQVSFRLAMPMKLKKIGYHWVMMEAFPLQMDAENNLVTHLNIFTPLRPFDSKEKIPLVGDIWSKHTRHEEWTQAIWKKVFASPNCFILTPEQRRIVDLLRKSPELTNAEVAQHLGKQKNTIDVQNKQILVRARDCFPLHAFETVKDVVALLNELAFFAKELHGTDEEDGNQIVEIW